MIVVIGDVLLDREIRGQVKRLAPDAPVPVLSDVESEFRLGGAGLAATRVAEQEAVTLITALGDDQEATQLRSLIRRWKIELVELPTSGRTRIKERYGTSDQVLLRVDLGDEMCAPEAFDADAVWLALAQADAVLVSDYGGGVTSTPAIREAVTRAAERVPVVWDPHPRGTAPIPDLTLVTPNRVEAGIHDDETLEHQLGALVAQWKSPVAMTMGAQGAVLATPSRIEYFPADAVDGDPCGAGDAFAAAATVALAQGQSLEKSVAFAVQFATEWVRCDKKREIPEVVVATGGCFDLLHVGHLETLRAARALGDRLVVLINSDRSVRELKGPDRPVNNETDRAAMLKAFSFVDEVIVFDESTPERALRSLRPDVWVKGGDYSVTELPESRVITQWGGRTEIVPYLTGHSTTRLINREIDLRTLEMQATRNEGL